MLCGLFEAHCALTRLPVWKHVNPVKRLCLEDFIPEVDVSCQVGVFLNSWCQSFEPVMARLPGLKVVRVSKAKHF